MQSISDLIKAKSSQDQTWREERQAERGTLSEMRDAALEEITTSPEAYQRFLMLQGDNMQYSVGNVALVMFQMPQATKIGTTDYWHSLGRYVRDDAMQEGAKVFVPPRDRQRRGYLMGNCYDISQTTGKPMKEPQPLVSNTERRNTALAALMRYSPVPIVEDNTLETPAYYDPGRLELAVNSTYTDTEVFSALATEISYARIHDKGRNTDFDRGTYRLDAESIGYLICRKFGVDQPMPQTDNLLELYDGYDAASRGETLEMLRKTARNIGDGIDRAIQPRQQERGGRHRGAR